MEIKKKRTLAGIFTRYICIFCIHTLLLVFLLILVFNAFVNAGFVLQANYTEVELNKNKDRIAEAEYVEADMVPESSTYGVYEASGRYLYGTFAEKDREAAWKCYRENRIFARGDGYYRFLLRRNGEICIVKYDIVAQFSKAFLRKYLPPPMVCLLILFVILFLLQAVWTSRHFGKKVYKELRLLNETTECIRRQNLEFEEMHSDIKEVEEVLCSLSRMRKALQESLEKQWKLEKNRREQAAALAHDIRTPLTVIKGNAELLGEEELGSVGKEYNQYILKNTEEIEEYLVILQDMMLSEDMKEKAVSVSCKEMAGNLADRARALAESFRIEAEVCVQDGLPITENGGILCCLGQIQRAWDNIVRNALEHTPEGKRIRVVIGYAEVTEALSARVLDGGSGFTEEELVHAAEQFYQGDKSRHERKHRGLGLYTASEFAERQGGKVMFGNAKEEEFGGEVVLMLRTKPIVK